MFDIVEPRPRGGILLAFGKLHDLTDSLVQELGHTIKYSRLQAREQPSRTGKCPFPPLRFAPDDA
ncbi:hypothetical protein TM102_28670 [Bradyrhizobium sp. TM102]|nr:hypothetical protein TM102_28670 [Bradyrhizobium sp. TM102]